MPIFCHMFCHFVSVLKLLSATGSKFCVMSVINCSTPKKFQWTQNVMTKSLKFVENCWKIILCAVNLGHTLKISFLVSDISLESSIKVKILVFVHAKPLPANYNIKCECFYSTYSIFLAVVHIVHMDGNVVFSVLFLWRKFVLFTNELNSRYGYNFTMRKIAFVWYSEVLYVPPLAGEHISISSFVSIIFYDLGLPKISTIFFKKTISIQNAC